MKRRTTLGVNSNVMDYVYQLYRFYFLSASANRIVQVSLRYDLCLGTNVFLIGHYKIMASL